MRRLALLALALPSLALAQGVAQAPHAASSTSGGLIPGGLTWPLNVVGGKLALYGPLIDDTGTTVANVYFDGVRLRDTRGLTYTQNGTVPQVASAEPTPAGAGAFSDSNYYSLGTGSDALDFAGDFSACVAFKPAAGDLGSFHVLLSNLDVGVAGYFAQINDTNHITATFAGVGGLVSTSTVVANVVNVVCFGRSGTTGYVKLNGDAIVSGAVGAATRATSNVFKLGRYEADGNPWGGTIYNAWFSSSAASDAVFTAIQASVKSRLRIAAW